VIATLAVAASVESATLRAPTVCVPALEGDVYTPDALIVPMDALPPAIVSTSHVTAVFALPPTVAAKVCVWPVVSPARLGLTLTVTGTDVMVMVTAVVLAVSATDCAVSVTVGGAGGVPGAV
jgi:hypothetical protein